MHHRRAQSGREPDRGRVEGVIVDDVVSSLAARRRRRAAKAASAAAAPVGGWTGGSVQRGRQRAGIDACVDHRHARHLRSGSGVKVDLVAPVHEAAREIGLRTPATRHAGAPGWPRRAGRRSRSSSRDHLVREVARRIDPQHVVGNPSPADGDGPPRPRRDRRSRSARQPPRGWRTRRTSLRRSSRTRSRGLRATGPGSARR